MNYEQKANKPEWFKSDPRNIYASATAGTSPFNEWYEFKDYKEAIESISSLFKSQSFIDRFTLSDDGTHYLDEEGLQASIQEMVEAESKF